MNSDEGVVTEVTLSTNQIKYLIDAMWSLTRHDSQALAFRYGVNDTSLEQYLQDSLKTALKP